MHEQQLRLQQEAEGLAQRLEVILHGNFQSHQTEFDSDTPIDKTITFLQAVIAVTPVLCVLLDSKHWPCAPAATNPAIAIASATAHGSTAVGFTEVGDTAAGFTPVGGAAAGP